jgi:hypothetical protein
MPEDRSRAQREEEDALRDSVDFEDERSESERFNALVSKIKSRGCKTCNE